jgi:predicted DsbA family dithiol-disulfide isomerase
LSQQQFDQCVDSKRTQAKVRAHEQLGEQQHIGATPSFIIGGKIIEGPRSYDQFKALVDAALASAGSPLATPGAESGAKKPAGAAKGTPSR